jgi:hypothetical protein
VRDGRARAGTSPASMLGRSAGGTLGTHAWGSAAQCRLVTGALGHAVDTHSTCVHTRACPCTRPAPMQAWLVRTHAHATHVDRRTHMAPAPTHAQADTRGRTHAHTHAHVHTRMQRPADASGAFLLSNDPLAGIMGQCRTRPECPFSPLDRARFGAGLAAWAEPCDPAPVERTQTRATAWWKPEPSSQQVACVCVCVCVCAWLECAPQRSAVQGWRRRRKGPRNPQARAFLDDSGLLGVLCEYFVHASEAVGKHSLLPPSAPPRLLGYPVGYSVSTLCMLRRQLGSARCPPPPLPFAYSGTM